MNDFTFSKELRDEVAVTLAEHVLLYEPRAYPAYGCSCCEWDGAQGDNGGPDDGSNDYIGGFLAHQADALMSLLERREREAGARALREALADVRTHNGRPVSQENLRWAATHEALCRSYIFDVLMGLANALDPADAITNGGDATTEEAE